MSRSEIEFDSIKAIDFVEGIGEGENITKEQEIEAWAYLIKTEIVWKLQGMFGRRATAIIEMGVINDEGEIDWNIFDEVYDD